MRMKERGNNLVDDPLSRERCFFFWRQHHQDLDTIGFLNMPPLFLIIIIFFLHHTFDKHLIRYPTLALATRHDTIRQNFFLSSFFFFLFGIEDGKFEHPLKGTDEKAAVSVGRGGEVGKTKTD